MHPDQGMFREMVRAAGFESCRYFNLSAGIMGGTAACGVTE